MDCDLCDDYQRCSGIPCPDHFLIEGFVKELKDAFQDGLPWGDVCYEYEMEAIRSESPTECSARIKEAEKADEKRADGAKNEFIVRKQTINLDTKTGMLKKSSGRACRDAEEPAKWVFGKKRFGNYKEWAATDPKATKKPLTRPSGVPPNAIFWGYGCEPHASGCCEHLHPGQAGYEAAKAGKKPQMEALMSKVVYLETKPAVRTPSPLMLDSW